MKAEDDIFEWLGRGAVEGGRVEAFRVVEVRWAVGRVRRLEDEQLFFPVVTNTLTGTIFRENVEEGQREHRDCFSCFNGSPARRVG